MIGYMIEQELGNLLTEPPRWTPETLPADAHIPQPSDDYLRHE